MPTLRPNWRPTMPNVVLDTNTLVSAALRSGSIPDRALRLAVSQETILISAAVLLEYDEVLARPKFARILTMDRRISFLALLSAVAIVVDAPEDRGGLSGPQGQQVSRSRLGGARRPDHFRRWRSAGSRSVERIQNPDPGILCGGQGDQGRCSLIAFDKETSWSILQI